MKEIQPPRLTRAGRGAREDGKMARRMERKIKKMHVVSDSAEGCSTVTTMSTLASLVRPGFHPAWFSVGFLDCCRCVALKPGKLDRS